MTGTSTGRAATPIYGREPGAARNRRTTFVEIATGGDEPALDETLAALGFARTGRHITKPVDLEQFITVVKSIEDFWLTIVTLPRPP